MADDFFRAGARAQGLTHVRQVLSLPLNYTPVAKGFFLLLFSGLQERDLFEIMRYIDIVSLVVFSVLYTASSQATHICRHSYEYIICFDNSYPGI